VVRLLATMRDAARLDVDLHPDGWQGGWPVRGTAARAKSNPQPPIFSLPQPQFSPTRNATMEQLLAKLGEDGFAKLNTASAADLDAMIRFAQDISPPAEPVLDYIAEVDTRRILFDELQTICQSHHLVANATIFAVFMVAPISEIRIHLQLLRDSAQVFLVSGTIGSAQHAIRACTLPFPSLGFPISSPAYFRLMLIKLYLPRARSPEALALSLPMAVPSATLNESGMPIYSTSVTRSGFSDRVRP